MTACPPRPASRPGRPGLVPILPLAALAALALPAAAARAGAAGENGADACRVGKLQQAEQSRAGGLEEATGTNLRHYPPDRVVDGLHMRLEMRFDDPAEARFTAVETLRVRPIGEPTASLTLDAVGLQIESVRADGDPVEFFVDDETVTLNFPAPLATGRDHEIVFHYACDHPTDGMFFSPASAHVQTYTTEVHTQGEAITNRHWFIAHDSPNDRLTTELIVDVPAAFSVSSNGHLVAQSTHDGRAVWHWLQDKPHATYLVSLVIGQFDVVDLEHPRVPMRVWVPRGTGERVPRTYGRTGEMIDLFEQRFGVPYPWDRYDQLCLKNFGAGGMENTSATSLYSTAVLDETALLDGDLDGLISHELAHQWSGDLLTCKGWAHIWLNEGFATFGADLWTEHREGEDGYLAGIERGMRGIARRDRTTDDDAMVSPIFADYNEPFRRRANPYGKGASILHMLRRMLGEEVFWSGMHLYMQRHAFGTVETSDFRYALEEVSGRGLEWFFDQWCYRPGVPHLKVGIAYDGAKRELRVDLEQTQHIDERTPAFRFTLPIHVRTASGPHVYPIDVDQTTRSFTTTLDGPPSVVAVDPKLAVLAALEVDKPQPLWEAQVQAGPTIVARARAVDALGRSDTPDHRALMGRIIRNESLHRALRNRAVRALRGYGSEAAKAEVLALLEAGVDEARVRVNLVEALQDQDAATAVPVLGTIAGHDPSYATRVAAIEGLAKLKAEDQADLIADLVNFPSQSDQVRRAALGALATLDDARGLDLAIEYASYGYGDRARPAAIRAIGTLGHFDRDRAVKVLLKLLEDPQRRPVSAAGRALAKLGHEKAVGPLEKMAETSPDPGRRKDAKRWLETLRKKLAEDKDKAKAGADAAG